MPYKPLDSDSVIDDFDPIKIEQMEVEFKTCPHCGGEGIRDNGLYAFNCPVCFGTGAVEVKKEG